FKRNDQMASTSFNNNNNYEGLSTTRTTRNALISVGFSVGFFPTLIPSDFPSDFPSDQCMGIFDEHVCVGLGYPTENST
ncbi:hypothetical protein PIB30_113176, partial [Stylosanthes scabra]|nr:hypothetical protein [Stylosanthes scabra]